MRGNVGTLVERFPLILRYTAFALISAAANWTMQLVVLRIVPGSLAVYPALATGTIAGFAIKYLLDKHYVFHHAPANREQEAWVLALYIGTSILMTAAYLSTQLVVFHYYGEGMAYFCAGNLALAMGYISKFILDDRFVFKAHRIGERPS